MTDAEGRWDGDRRKVYRNPRFCRENVYFCQRQRLRSPAAMVIWQKTGVKWKGVAAAKGRWDDSRKKYTRNRDFAGKMYILPATTTMCRKFKPSTQVDSILQKFSPFRFDFFAFAVYNKYKNLILVKSR